LWHAIHREHARVTLVLFILLECSAVRDCALVRYTTHHALECAVVGVECSQWIQPSGARVKRERERR